jgi:hypothetical protein
MPLSDAFRQLPYDPSLLHLQLSRNGPTRCIRLGAEVRIKFGRIALAKPRKLRFKRSGGGLQLAAAAQVDGQKLYFNAN